MKTLKEAWAVGLRDYLRDFTWTKEILGILFILAILIGFGEGLGTIVTLPNTQSYVSYFATGVLSYFLAITALNAGTSLILDKKGFSKLLLVAPISQSSIMLGKLCNVIISSAMFLIAALAIMIYINTLTLTHILLFIFVVFITLLMFLGISFLYSSYFKNSKKAQEIQGYGYLIMFFLSGILHPITSLPTAIRPLFYINPLTYAAEAVRYAMTGTHTIPLEITFPALIILAILFSTLGIWLYDKKLGN